jgi:hypothetical protein
VNITKDTIAWRGTVTVFLTATLALLFYLVTGASNPQPRLQAHTTTTWEAFPGEHVVTSMLYQGEDREAWWEGHEALWKRGYARSDDR